MKKTLAKAVWWVLMGVAAITAFTTIFNVVMYFLEAPELGATHWSKAAEASNTYLITILLAYYVDTKYVKELK